MKRILLLSLTLALTASFAWAHGKEGHKNLKVLEGLDHKPLDKGMKALTKSLGVQCKNCHVEKKWDLDDVPAKVEARKFLQAALATEDEAARKAALQPLLVALKKEAPKNEAALWKTIDAWKKDLTAVKAKKGNDHKEHHGHRESAPQKTSPGG